MLDLTQFSHRTFMSHFLEFIPENGGDTVLVDELETGCKFTVVMTTGGELYRYCLGDIVEVTDIMDDIPIIRFLGRDQISDQVGEKLNETEVVHAQGEIQSMINEKIDFWMLGPEQDLSGTISYVLLIQCNGLENKELQKLIASVLATLLRKMCTIVMLGRLVS